MYSYRVFDGAEYDEDGNYCDEEPKRNFYIPKVSVMRMYNTLEVVVRTEPEKEEKPNANNRR